MFQAKPWVLDRIEQSFWIFFKRPLMIILPFLLFHIVMFIIIPEIWKFTLWPILMQQNSISSTIHILALLGLSYALIYLMGMIPITYATIKTICETTSWESTDMKKNIKEGFSLIGKIFTVYWFIFAYAYLMPALCFIAGGSLLLGGIIWDIEILRNVWMIFMWLSFLYAIIQWVYRGLKTSFALSSAIYNQNYEKQTFETSIRMTDGKWWRILGNFLLVWLIGWLMIGLVSWFIESLVFLWGSNENNVLSFLQGEEFFNIEKLQNMFGEILSFNIFTLIADICNTILNTIFTTFIIVFSVVFYLRLRDEYYHEEGTDDSDSLSRETLPILEEL